jgi:hypothetical protein
MAIPLSQLATAGQQQAPQSTQASLASMVPQPQLPQTQPVMPQAGQPAMPQTGQSGNPIESAYFDRLANDYEGLKAEYASLTDNEGKNTTDGGRILNTDDAREMSPEYRMDRTRSADVHEPSSAFVKQMYAEKLMQDTPPGQHNTVVFTAGGTGAGKTTGLQEAQKVNQNIQNAEIVYDTNMNSFESADKKVQQALKAGRNASIIYTYRDPVEALENGALTRASRMEAEMGTGRTVPIDEHFKTHAGSREVMEQLQAKYGDDHRFHMMVIDNSRGKGNAAVVSGLDKLPKLDHTVVRKGLNDALESQYKSGKISRAIYEGTRGNAR